MPTEYVNHRISKTRLNRDTRVLIIDTGAFTVDAGAGFDYYIPIKVQEKEIKIKAVRFWVGVVKEWVGEVGVILSEDLVSYSGTGQVPESGPIVHWDVHRHAVNPYESTNTFYFQDGAEPAYKEDDTLYLGFNGINLGAATYAAHVRIWIYYKFRE